MSRVARAARNASLLRVETLAPSADGTVSAPTKTIQDAETGELYFINIASNTCVVQLPAPREGMYFKFILNLASNDEDTKDFALITDSTDTDMHGGILVNGSIVEVVARSTIQLDSSAGAATTGDFLECISDGSAWYVFGNLDSASSLAVNNGHALA